MTLADIIAVFQEEDGKNIAHNRATSPTVIWHIVAQLDFNQAFKYATEHPDTI